MSMLHRVPYGTVDVILSYCHNSLHDTSPLPVRGALRILLTVRAVEGMYIVHDRYSDHV